ncbi:poly(A) RNA polymerase GLD2 [Corythoichthys intestinalis]|uniref:poly(A) RNA polymerase GLD2 n=1 Tax=Corythoichthys intestinalis TaxID=161448 RepID=UPI0025A55FE4|nr:poly(A) RNA polymerase GLD2 [Corythoichthys intestinalis]
MNSRYPSHVPAPMDPNSNRHGGIDGLFANERNPDPLPPPPPHRNNKDWRKRKHEDHFAPDAKRRRADNSTHPMSQQSLHARHFSNTDREVAGSSRSSSSVLNHLHPSTNYSSNSDDPANPCSSMFISPYANDKLSSQMFNLFKMCTQQPSDLNCKEMCRTWLQQDVRVFEMGRLYMTGSTMSGFASRSSDADLCYVLHESFQKKKDPVAVLYALQRILKSKDYLDKLHLIRAKVPILRFRRKGSNQIFDLNVNNTVGIRNTFLLKSYAFVEPRVRPLVLVIKKWARHHKINDASQGTLSSYALALMVLHYLQTREKPVLPSLQLDFPECFDPTLDIDMIPERAKCIPRYCSDNNSSLGMLLLGFLRYYATEFSWEKSVISVRTGRALPKEDNQEWRGKFICVEEPFERKNVARAVYKRDKFDAIKTQFFKSWRTLQWRMDLNAFLPVQEIIDDETSLYKLF